MGALVDKIMRGDYDTERQPWNDVSAEGKDMVRRLLQPDPGKRLSAAAALEHPWLLCGMAEDKEWTRLPRSRTVYVRASRRKARANSGC